MKQSTRVTTIFWILRHFGSGLSDLYNMQKRNYLFFYLLPNSSDPQNAQTPSPCPLYMTQHPGNRDSGSSYHSPGMCRMINITLSIRLRRQINVQAMFAE